MKLLIWLRTQLIRWFNSWSFEFQLGDKVRIRANGREGMITAGYFMYDTPCYEVDFIGVPFQASQLELVVE